MRGGLSRRQFLKVTASGALALVVPWAIEGCAGDEEVEFFTPHERATLEAATARILPADQDRGAREAGAARYIENLLSAFEREPPLVFAGGPFSGRLPLPDNETGEPSSDSPKNSFEDFVPLSRIREIAWRVRLFGSTNVPGGDFNDAVLGPTDGLRDVYRRGLEELDAKSRELFSRSFVELAPEEQDSVLAEADQAFVGKLVEHTLEGAYAAPEYGGNRELVGWRSTKYDGDSQPLGYSIFHKSTGGYNELPDKPTSGPNPDEDFRGLDQEAVEFLEPIVIGIGGKRFF